MADLSVKAIDHIVLNVDDVEVSAKWYSTILGMKREKITPKQGGEPRNILLFGSQKINIRPKTTSQTEWFTAKNAVQGTADLCFLVDVTPDEVVKHLNAHGVEIELGPVTKEGALGKIHSVYCRDPDGSLIEISSYQPMERGFF
ncbi:VOC family protein [Acetobacter thailandicus]|uniref:VOC family protein n=1 Tax=Acetobacter thailandicus TaxID=1502842 RepID=UPI001BAAB694|nr:VOC family protein [Acetobacter thailandicus]MBS0961448.1 VOC family protein [Acetobacter thailandicus]